MPRRVCKFYNRGYCRNGARCRYFHEGAPVYDSAITLPDPDPAIPETHVGPNNEDWVNAAEFVPLSSGQHVDDQPAASLKARLKIRCCCKHISTVFKTRGVDTNGNESDDDSECELEKMCRRPSINSSSSSASRNQVPQVASAPVPGPPSFPEPSVEALARSREQTCGICYEVVMEKPERENRFGILPNCNHCFCLSCIRKWRQARQFENKIIRACPECRVTSDYICPSAIWADSNSDKEKLLADYKMALSQKPCKHFKQGRAKCPFGNKCFYLHALPDGTIADVGPPVRRPRNRELDIDMAQRLVIWSYLQEREAERLLRNSRLDVDNENFDEEDDWYAIMY